MPEYRPRLTPDEYNLIKAYRDGAATQVERSKPTERNVFVVGDLHEPFTLEGYLEHCKHVYDKFNCNHVVFIGDIIDNHFSSYHETVPDSKQQLR
ncbi:MAG TPA: hypothetical protein DDY13_09320, partial [Cytophagales bacterium]|nr:hypothetical protein [Cytophagales bacterium]